MPKSVFTDAYALLVQRLVAFRKQQGVTQVQLAAALGKPQSFVSTIERRVRRVDILEFYALAKALGADPAVLYGEITSALPERVDI